MIPDIDDERIRRLDGGLLLVLRELLRLRRTTLVADRLGMSQSAVSHALGRLRIALDDPLFVRRPHGLDPTPRALALIPVVDSLFAVLGELIDQGGDFDPATARRDLRIGCPDHLATTLAPALLALVRRDAPGCRLAFSQHLGHEALAALGRHEIDLALGRFGARPGRDVVVDVLGTDEYCLIAARSNATVGPGLDRERYLELDHVQVLQSGDFRTDEIERIGNQALPRHPVMVVPRFLMAFPIVAATDAVAVVPRRLAAAHADAFGLAIHPVPVPLPPIRQLAVRRAGPDPAVEWLLDEVRAATATDS